MHTNLLPIGVMKSNITVNYKSVMINFTNILYIIISNNSDNI